MTSISRTTVTMLVLAGAALLFAPSAGAAITGSQVAPPPSPTFSIWDSDNPNTIAVSGTTSGGNPATDKVDLDCYNGPGSFDTLDSAVSLNPDGSFSVPAADLSNIDDEVCRLRAVPAGTNPPDLSTFNGPLMATGERETDKLTTGPNTGLAYDYYIWSQGLTAAVDFDSAGSCGLDDGYLFGADLARTTTTFYCNDWFDRVNTYSGTPTRSGLQVDGANAYMPEIAREISQDASGLPAVSYSYTQNPANGDLTIHETDPIVKCPAATYPPTSASCPSFVGTGVRLDRTILVTNDAHLTTFSDQYVSVDGAAHTMSLLPQNDQRFSFSGGNGAKIAYRFPGESAFSTHAEGDNVAFPDASPTSPGVVSINVQGAADGDTSTGQAAIVFDHSASPATFNYADTSNSDLAFTQSATVPAGGSTLLRFAYAQAYTSAEVAALVDQAKRSFLPPVPTPAPPPPSNSFKFGKVKLNKKKGTAKLSVSVPGPGKLAASGKGVKKVTLNVVKAGVVKVPIAVTGKLAHKLKKTHKVKVKVSVTFTPTGGTASSQVVKVKLIRKQPGKKKHG